jgi:hypothetical protein
MRRLVSLRHAYVVRHSRRNAGESTGGGWHTTIKRRDGSWSDSFDTHTRWGAERKAARLAAMSERTPSTYDPEAPYELRGEIEI